MSEQMDVVFQVMSAMGAEERDNFVDSLETVMDPAHLADLRATQVRLDRVQEVLGTQAVVDLLARCYDQAKEIGRPFSEVLNIAITEIERS